MYTYICGGFFYCPSRETLPIYTYIYIYIYIYTYIYIYMFKKLFSFSWLSIIQTILKSTHSQDQTLQPKISKIWRLTLGSIKNWEFFSQNREIGAESKALASWTVAPLSWYIKGYTSSSYKFDESLCAFFEAILEMISLLKLLIRCKQKLIQNWWWVTGDSFLVFWY